MTAAPLARVLIVDDEAAHMRALCDTLEHQGYYTEGFTAGKDALGALQTSQFDLLLTDLMMPEMDGVELLAAALKTDPHLVGVLMTGQGTIATAVQAMQAGALDYILKPFKVSALLPVVARAVGVRRLRLENLELRNTVAIHELNQAIAHTLDPNILLDKIADAALAQFEADEASIMLPTADGGSLYVAAVRGERREALLGSRMPIGQGIAGRVATLREPMVLQGEIGDAQPAPLHPRAAIQSALSMPMITRNRLIGVLNINYTRQPRTIPLGQIKVLGIFVNAAAAGIEAARLHDDQRKSEARYRNVLNMAADAIVSLDHERRITIFNAAAERIFGWSAAEVIGRPVETLIPERLAAAHRRHIAAFDQAADTTVPMQGRGPFYARRKEGTEFPVEISIARLVEGSNQVYTAVLRDITQRVQQEQKIARLTRLYALLSGVNSTIVRVLDETELFREICRIALDLGEFLSAWIGTFDAEKQEVTLVASAGSALKEGLFQVSLAEPGGAGLLAQAALEARLAWDNDLGARPNTGFLRRHAPAARAGAALPFIVDDAVKGVMVLYAATPDAFGDAEISLLRELAGDVAFALDHIAKTRQVNYLATHDQLTGLANRTLFLDRLAQAAASAKDKGELLAVVLADVERFKQVNDTFGRYAGDALLRQISERVQNAVQDGARLARVGPDIFSMIFSGFTQAGEVAKLVHRRLGAVMAAPFNIGDQALHLAARAGVAFFPADGADAETLFHNAEAALRRAKAEHERVAFYTPDLNARVAEQLVLESKLRQALERKEFILHYQPKVSLRTGRIVGLEALIRWQDPESGLVPPVKFISLLEDTGLIVAAGGWAMQEALRAVASLRAKGLPPVRIAVNVSPIQLRQKDFVRSVELAISSAGGKPHGLDLEITESVIMHDVEESVRKLNDVRSMGVELSIDDFGTGYSSLAYIARLPVGVIKIDRAFIRNVAGDANSESMVASIISLTHALKRKVVAEGVETEEQAQLLRRLKGDQYQGYLFSRPVPLEQIEILLRANQGKSKSPN